MFGYQYCHFPADILDEITAKCEKFAVFTKSMEYYKLLFH